MTRVTVAGIRCHLYRESPRDLGEPGRSPWWRFADEGGDLSWVLVFVLRHVSLTHSHATLPFLILMSVALSAIQGTTFSATDPRYSLPFLPVSSPPPHPQPCPSFPPLIPPTTFLYPNSPLFLHTAHARWLPRGCPVVAYDSDVHAYII